MRNAVGWRGRMSSWKEGGGKTPAGILPLDEEGGDMNA